MFVNPILQSTIIHVDLLARMDATHKARCIWLLCFLHMLQEAPEFLIREQLRIYCNPKKFYLHKFVRLLKLCSLSFQCFIDQTRCSEREHNNNNNNERNTKVSVSSEDVTPWIVQESFNIICAATNMLVDECADVMSSTPSERKTLVRGILDLLLSVLSTPQSTVTHLRALGGASQTLDTFGAALFLETTENNLQHWLRVILSLMNSTALSVRSISVDFIISLLGGVFNERGTIDDITMVLLTVLPEVAGREIGLYSASGRIETIEDVSCTLWPLRRALADVEESDPDDDERVDVQLAPFIVSMCRSCQAVIDGVLIELRLMGDDCQIVGTHIPVEGYLYSNEQGDRTTHGSGYTFDADEESLFEAANSFLPETAPLQRLRWLLTLNRLHESKGQWVEAAETLVLCAKTIIGAMLHIKNVWRASRYVLWYDPEKSLWIPTVGLGVEQGTGTERTSGTGRTKNNEKVMEFADYFLEPPGVFGMTKMKPRNKKSWKALDRPSVSTLCRMLTNVSKVAVRSYLEEGGIEELAFLKLEELLKQIMELVEDHGTTNKQQQYIGVSSSSSSGGGARDKFNRKQFVEENAALRMMSASLNGEMTKLAEQLLLVSEEDEVSTTHSQRERDLLEKQTLVREKKYYVRVLLLGKKPNRFIESTTIPTFLEWGSPSICRVSKAAVLWANGRIEKTSDSSKPSKLQGTLEERICAAFSQPLLLALSKELSIDSVLLCTQPPSKAMLDREGGNKTFLVVNLVHMDSSSLVFDKGNTSPKDGAWADGSKRFFFKSQARAQAQSEEAQIQTHTQRTTGLVELTVAKKFPCGLSRQRALFTSEFFSG